MLRRVALATAVVLVALTAGCDFPRDPDGTLELVTGGTLRVGLTPNDPWTEIGPDGAGGIEVDLVEEFAAGIEADITWREGAEEPLIDALERGELDLVIAGFTDKSPWAMLASMTRTYAIVRGEDGKPEGHVMAVPMGENGFQVALEDFLLDRSAEAEAAFEAAS